MEEDGCCRVVYRRNSLDPGQKYSFTVYPMLQRESDPAVVWEGGDDVSLGEGTVPSLTNGTTRGASNGNGQDTDSSGSEPPSDRGPSNGTGNSGA